MYISVSVYMCIYTCVYTYMYIYTYIDLLIRQLWRGKSRQRQSKLDVPNVCFPTTPLPSGAAAARRSTNLARCLAQYDVYLNQNDVYSINQHDVYFKF